MTYDEETYVFNALKELKSFINNQKIEQLIRETHENNIMIKDSAYTNPDVFKTAMSGVYLVYELATPTTESADPYTNPQIVSNWGTEQFVDERDVPVPV